MIKKNILAGLALILVTPTYLNAASIRGAADEIVNLSYSSGGSLSGHIFMDGIIGEDTPINSGDFLLSDNGHGETSLEFQTGNFISLVDGVYTWAGGGIITHGGSLGLGSPTPPGDLIVSDATILDGNWNEPITAQFEDSGDFVISGSGTDIKDQTLLDYFGIDAADNSWLFTFELIIPSGSNLLSFEPDSSFVQTGVDTGDSQLFFTNTNTTTDVPEPMTLTLLILGLSYFGFNFWLNLFRANGLD